MNDVRLQALEDWARLDTRDEQTSRVVLELVREVRRLRKELQSSALDYLALEGQTWEQPAPVPVLTAPQLPQQEMDGIRVRLMSERPRPLVVYPAPVPPFRGILDGITAADVYGVHI